VTLRHFAPQAVRDIEEAVDWFAAGPGAEPLARKFATAAAAAARPITRRPLVGHRRLVLLPDPFRFHRVQGFPYLLVYNAERPMPQVLRVLHMARDLGPLLTELVDEFDPRR
jgi:toxin ParE1/3/4